MRLITQIGYYIALLLCLTPTLLHGEVKQKPDTPFVISGNVYGIDTQQTIPYTTVTIENDSAKVITRLACDVEGAFEARLAKPGNYTFIFTSVGYETTPTQVTITPSPYKQSIGKVAMKAGVELQEIEVVTQKPLIKSDIDKIAYSVEADPEAQTSSVLDMLRKVPLVTVDGEENIQLKGQSNFKVLINGKSSSMLNGSLKDVLRSIPASSIKDIEVITNPSSKYEAEGVGGIINIVTTRRGIEGVMGSVGVNANTRGNGRGGYGGHGYVNAKMGKLSLSLRGYASNQQWAESTTETEQENFKSDQYRYFKSHALATGRGTYYNFSGEASYEIDSLNLITASMWGNGGNNHYDSDIENQEFDINKTPTRNQSITNRGIGTRFGLSGNIDYQRSFAKPDQLFTVSYKLDNNTSKSTNNNLYHSTLGYSPYAQNSSDDQLGAEHTLQADYFDPINDQHQIETGLKYILRLNNSDGQIHNDIAGGENQRITSLDYTQHILGVYIGYLFKYKNFGVKVGARIETTLNDAQFVLRRDTSFRSVLFNPIPYLTLSYKIDDKQTIKLAYTQRLSRPGISYLNPYIDDNNPTQIRTGNPSLKSEISHSLSLDFSRFTEKYNISASLFASLLDNGIEEVNTINSQGVTFITYQNTARQRSIGASLYGSVKITKKINLYLNGSGGYRKMSRTGALSFSNEGFYGNAYANLSYNAWKDGTLSAMGGIFSQPVTSQSTGTIYHFHSLSIRQQFFKNKLQVQLGASNPFLYKMEVRNTTYVPDNLQGSTQYGYIVQSFFIGVSYNFGKMAQGGVKKARRGINNDDIKQEESNKTPSN